MPRLCAVDRALSSMAATPAAGSFQMPELDQPARRLPYSPSGASNSFSLFTASSRASIIQASSAS
jgi:hypothetical protein